MVRFLLNRGVEWGYRLRSEEWRLQPRGEIMRYLLRDDQIAETLLEQLAQASFRVVEGSVPDSLTEDIRVGLYVALHQVLADTLIKSPDCGNLSVCAELREEHPFTSQPAHAMRVRG